MLFTLVHLFICLYKITEPRSWLRQQQQQQPVEQLNEQRAGEVQTSPSAARDSYIRNNFWHANTRFSIGKNGTGPSWSTWLCSIQWHALQLGGSYFFCQFPVTVESTAKTCPATHNLTGSFAVQPISRQHTFYTYIWNHVNTHAPSNHLEPYFHPTCDFHTCRVDAIRLQAYPEADKVWTNEMQTEDQFQQPKNGACTFSNQKKCSGEKPCQDGQQGFWNTEGPRSQ